METKILLISPQKEKHNLFKKYLPGNNKLFYAVNVFGFVRYFKTETGAHNFLKKQGFIYDINTGNYNKTRMSEDEIFFMQNTQTII